MEWGGGRRTTKNAEKDVFSFCKPVAMVDLNLHYHFVYHLKSTTSVEAGCLMQQCRLQCWLLSSYNLLYLFVCFFLSFSLTACYLDVIVSAFRFWIICATLPLHRLVSLLLGRQDRKCTPGLAYTKDEAQRYGGRLKHIIIRYFGYLTGRRDLKETGFISDHITDDPGERLDRRWRATDLLAAWTEDC